MASSSTSPTARTLKVLKDRGIPACVVEKWVPMARGGGPDAMFPDAKASKMGGFRKDAFGFIDIIALDGLPGVLAVQCCGATGFADHLRKINGIDEARLWLAAGNRLELWSWRKAIKNGKTVWEAKASPLVWYELFSHSAVPRGEIITTYEKQAREGQETES